jgi:ribosomal protein L37AE/L43A
VVAVGRWWNSVDETWNKRTCPSCDSDDIRSLKAGRWQCQDCGFEWEE